MLRRFGRLTEAVGCVLLLDWKLNSPVFLSRPNRTTFRIPRRSFHFHHRLNPQPEIGPLHPHKHQCRFGMALENHTATVDIRGGQCVHSVKNWGCMDSLVEGTKILRNFHLTNQGSELLECVFDLQIIDRSDPELRQIIVSTTADVARYP